MPRWCMWTNGTRPVGEPGNNPSFHGILAEQKSLVGSGVVLNTSFNIHEEPIIRTPEHAINAFLARAWMPAVGNTLVKQPGRA